MNGFEGAILKALLKTIPMIERVQNALSSYLYTPKLYDNRKTLH